MKRRRVAVLFGGRSAEHEISCISARSVIDALDPATVEVVPVGITREGMWRVLSGPPALPAETGAMPQVLSSDGAGIELAGEPGTRELVRSDGSREAVDVVFPVLHGPMGEDGAVQGMLELAGVPYVGAGGMIAVEVSGGVDGGKAFCDALELAWVATSLGGTHTLVGHAASTTHRQYAPEARRAAGITAGLVRVSVGLEDADDLLDDIVRALEQI